MNPPAADASQSAQPPRWFQISIMRLLFLLIVIGGGILFWPVSPVIAVVLFLPALVFKAWTKRIVASLILLLLIVVAISNLPQFKAARITRAKSNLSLIMAALETYRKDFGAYPPETFSASNGSEVLHHYLCRRMQAGEIHYGPYIENVAAGDLDGNGIPELNTIWGRDYIYVALADGTIWVIDRGPDGFLGGTVSPEKGFVPDGSDANGDGVTDDRDNIFAFPVAPTGGGL
jgi:type II secretory pathway pseudopilin PulG